MSSVYFGPENEYSKNTVHNKGVGKHQDKNTSRQAYSFVLSKRHHLPFHSFSLPQLNFSLYRYYSCSKCTQGSYPMGPCRQIHPLHYLQMAQSRVELGH